MKPQALIAASLRLKSPLRLLIQPRAIMKTRALATGIIAVVLIGCRTDRAASPRNAASQRAVTVAVWDGQTVVDPSQD